MSARLIKAVPLRGGLLIRTIRAETMARAGATVDGVTGTRRVIPVAAKVGGHTVPIGADNIRVGLGN